MMEPLESQPVIAGLSYETDDCGWAIHQGGTTNVDKVIQYFNYSYHDVVALYCHSAQLDSSTILGHGWMPFINFSTRRLATMETSQNHPLSIG